MDTSTLSEALGAIDSSLTSVLFEVTLKIASLCQCEVFLITDKNGKRRFAGSQLLCDAYTLGNLRPSDPAKEPHASDLLPEMGVASEVRWSLAVGDGDKDAFRSKHNATAGETEVDIGAKKAAGGKESRDLREKRKIVKVRSYNLDSEDDSESSEEEERNMRNEGPFRRKRIAKTVEFLQKSKRIRFSQAAGQHSTLSERPDPTKDWTDCDPDGLCLFPPLPPEREKDLFANEESASPFSGFSVDATPPEASTPRRNPPRNTNSPRNRNPSSSKSQKPNASLGRPRGDVGKYTEKSGLNIGEDNNNNSSSDMINSISNNDIIRNKNKNDDPKGHSISRRSPNPVPLLESSHNSTSSSSLPVADNLFDLFIPPFPSGQRIIKSEFSPLEIAKDASAEMAGPSDGNTDALLAENKMDLDSPGLKERVLSLAPSGRALVFSASRGLEEVEMKSDSVADFFECRADSIPKDKVSALRLISPEKIYKKGSSEYRLLTSSMSQLGRSIADYCKDRGIKNPQDPASKMLLNTLFDAWMRSELPHLHKTKVRPCDGRTSLGFLRHLTRVTFYCCFKKNKGNQKTGKAVAITFPGFE